MRNKISVLLTSAAVLVVCSGATCRQETAQSVIDTFLNTLAQTAAQELIKGNAKPLSTTTGPFAAEEAVP